jgi:outer membrane protein OmpA-like peptidoglycan-associated protein
LNNEDTLQITRSYSDFWFGISGGGNVNYYFGTFKSLVDPSFPYDSLVNPLINYSGNFGYGLNFGFVFEYLPKEEYFGITLKINAVENRMIDMLGESSNLANQENYQINGLMSYVSIAPSFRFSLPFNDWYVYGGPIYEFRQTNTLNHYTSLENISDISQVRKNVVQNVENRIGFQGGLGFEFLVADVEDLFRIKMAPFISFSSGQNVFGDQTFPTTSGTTITNSPNINTIMAAGGVTIKIGVDEVRYDTLKFDENYVTPTEAYAKASDDRGFTGEAFIKQDLVASNSINLVEAGKVKEQVSEEPVFAKELAEEKKEEVPIAKVDVKLNTSRVFSYVNSTTTELSKDMKDYLTALADYMKANPNTNAQIVGHTDNIGTADEKQARSDARSKNALRFLQSKGINSRRILARGESDRKPIADARTDEGRRKNRRIEITIVNRP